MNYRLSLGLLSLTCAALLAGCGGSAPSTNPGTAPGTTPPVTTPPGPGNGGTTDLTISGRVTVPAGQTVDGAQVLACYQGKCDDPKSKQVAVNSSGSYSLSGLEKAQYGMLAFKDVNGDKNIGAGDLIARLPDPVTPPAQNVDLALAVQGGGGSGGDGGGTGGTIAGQVAAPQGGNVGGTLIVLCVGDDCGTAGQVASTTAASAPYQTQTVPAGTYEVYALKDANGNQKFDAGDYLGIYTRDGRAPTPVTPPAQGVDIQMQTYSPSGRVVSPALRQELSRHLAPRARHGF